MLAKSVEPNPVFDEFLKTIGVLNYSWTNTESLLIHLIAGLAKVNKDTATIIFLTLNTTRARLDLVGRLSKMDGVSKDCRDAVADVIREMHTVLTTRNRYNHCIYSFDADGQNAKTIMMRIFDKKEELKYGQERQIDQQELGFLKQCLARLETINGRIWAIVKRHHFPA